ncbi:MAG TPA: CsgG/HfaB family protein [Deltaproteobacteria bacterium]|nr:CsgG/HfaB family protein [Deltaproteobacteria bacterium]HPR54420.1 CsgG/HfaB family protein [Deltaproteobacteria bacterium]HXK46251.1 CsgG/HfaB family protein [Deltaproteobacteria bacterium]
MREFGYAVCFLLMGVLALPGCATTSGEYEGVRTVAVWDLEDLSPGAGGRPDLGQLLSGEIIQAVQGSDVQVVERQKILAILEELNLGSSALADEETRLRVGRMIGAGEMVFGGYMVVGSTMRVDLRRVDVESGRIVKTAKGTADSGDLAGWLSTARKAGAELYH